MHNFIILNTAAFLWSAWRRRYLIVVPIFVIPLLALGIGISSPKKYSSYTTVLIQEAAKMNPFLEDLAVETNLKSRIDALNALLHSRCWPAGGLLVEHFDVLANSGPVRSRDFILVFALSALLGFVGC